APLRQGGIDALLVQRLRSAAGMGPSTQGSFCAQEVHFRGGHQLHRRVQGKGRIAAILHIDGGISLVSRFNNGTAYTYTYILRREIIIGRFIHVPANTRIVVTAQVALDGSAYVDVRPVAG